MSFDREYKNRKDRRKPYRGCRAFDRACRLGGSCAHCRRNRQHRDAKMQAAHRSDMEAQK